MTSTTMAKLGKIALLLLSVFLLGYLLPERIRIPVAGATSRDWNPKSFWFEPWGSSGVHKGIDIFGARGTKILSSVDGVVVFTGQIVKGGNVVAVLGPKWRIHYYAHLDTITASRFDWVASGEPIGTLGDSGNAKGKPPHLHYSVIRLVPAPWARDESTQGHKKAYFIDPGAFLQGARPAAR